MKAVRMHHVGGPAVLKVEEVDLPKFHTGQALIQVHAASVNPVDTKIRAGKFKLFKAKLPAIIGRDVAGVVCYADRSGFAVGDAVFGMLDYEHGANAEYTMASTRELAI